MQRKAFKDLTVMTAVNLLTSAKLLHDSGCNEWQFVYEGAIAMIDADNKQEVLDQLTFNPFILSA